MADERKVAIVTGASSGVGRAAALALASVGFDVALVARSEDKLLDTAEAIESSCAAKTLVLPTDLTDADATRAVVGRTVLRFHRVDALANCAGYASITPIENITPEEWRRTVDANLSYVMHLTATAWPVFKRLGGGVIVNVSSMASVDPFPGFALYAPAKAALNMFTHVTAGEGRELNIKAVALALGAVETPMLRSMFDTKQVPTEKCLSPEAVAERIRDYITGAEAFTNGETVRMVC